MSWLTAHVLGLWRRWQARDERTAPPRRQTVLCVGGVLNSVLDRVLEPGAYDVSFLESVEGAYSHIADTMPDRVVICTRADDDATLQVLSMLNLDPRTSSIPILTCIVPMAESLEDIRRGGGAPSAGPVVVMH